VIDWQDAHLKGQQAEDYLELVTSAAEMDNGPGFQLVRICRMESIG
jgi:hypothetical protein